MYIKKLKKRKKISALIVSLILLFIFSFKLNNVTTEGNKVDNNKLEVSVPASPIDINDLGGNDWAWATGQPWFGGGSGTLDDPYILEDLIIDGSWTSICITIRNSEAHFIIRNCTLFNSGGGAGAPAIWLDTVANGTVIDNYCYDNLRGIIIQDGFYNKISNNNFFNTTDYYGIRLEHCDNHSIVGNEIIRGKGGIDIFDSNNTVISKNIAKDNERYGLYMTISFHNNISGNTFQNNSMSGIILKGSSSNTISDNIAFNNTEHGIWLAPINSDHSDENVISSNVLDNNTLSGIYLFNASNNQVLNNEISDNVYGAIASPDADYNQFSENLFLRNKKHAYDFGANNDWNSLTIGNYWDNYTGTDANYDGIGDTPHDITGDSGSKDYLPIWDDGVPLINITSPLNNTNIGRDAPDFLVEITEPNLDTMWYTIDGGINNITCTSNGTIDQTSWETLWDSLAKGDNITIMFYANDTYGHLGSNFIVLIKHVPDDIIGLDFFATSLLILITSGIAFIAIIAKIHFKKRIISH